MIVKEEELNRIIKKYFYMKIVVVEVDGIVSSKTTFIKTICKYKYEKGVLYIGDLINNIKINCVNIYKMLFDENKEILKIKLDDSLSLKIRVMK